MAEHHPNGHTLCIHSVVVDSSLRRKKVGTWMLRNYVKQILNKQKNVEVILLICKKNLLEFYKDCGFILIGPSSVVHGKEEWYEMKLEVSNNK